MTICAKCNVNVARLSPCEACFLKAHPNFKYPNDDNSTRRATTSHERDTEDERKT